MPGADPILEGLNAPQREAVAHQDGPLLVLAGPGSGKTRVITRRAARLARDAAPPGAILAITFTNKSADEMRRRITALGAGAGMWICTFHSLGARLLRAYGERIGVDRGFSIYDEADRKQTMRSAMAEAGVGGHVLTVDRAVHAISAAKNELRSPRGYEATAADFNERMIARVYAAYEELLRKQNAVDFDDLLLKPAVMLGEDDELRGMLNRRFQFVLIDEYQDTNHAQYLMARRLSEENQNICATGDPDQSIYGWRGANLDNILDFERDYPETRVVRLEQNYRSTGAILRAASTVIRANRRRKDKDLWTEGDDGDPLRVWRFAGGGEEAEHVAQTIATLAETDEFEYADFAIMYRVNAVSRGLEDALRARRIPYRIVRGVEFYNRREIRDTVAYLRVLMNPRDEQALLRIINTPARGIGKKTIDRLLAAAQRTGEPLSATIRRAGDVPGIAAGTTKKLRRFVALLDRLGDYVGGPLSELVSQTLQESGYEQHLREAEDDSSEDRLANVMELVTVAARYQQEEPDGDLEGFLARVSLTSDQDAVDPNAGCVQLMTLHAAKGLEFPVVFLVGLEQGLLPHERTLSGPFGVDEATLEEERRLFFVGLTRAMRRLFVSYADTRAIRGRLTPRAASQFVGELPDSAAVVETISKSAYGDARSRYNDEEAVWDEAEIAPADGARPTRRPGGFRPRPERRFEFQETETVFSVDDPTTGAAPTERGPYADWSAGTWVRHEGLGVGQVLWIQHSPTQTRAAIKFAGQGQRVYILEHAPILRLERPSRS